MQLTFHHRQCTRILPLKHLQLRFIDANGNLDVPLAAVSRPFYAAGYDFSFCAFDTLLACFRHPWYAPSDRNRNACLDFHFSLGYTTIRPLIEEFAPPSDFCFINHLCVARAWL